MPNTSQQHSPPGARGSEDQLAELHGLMTSYFKSALARSEKSGEPLPPSLLNAMRQFLKDNGIDCIGRDNLDLNDLARDLPVFLEQEKDDMVRYGDVLLS